MFTVNDFLNAGNPVNDTFFDNTAVSTDTYQTLVLWHRSFMLDGDAQEAALAHGQYLL